MSLSLLILVIVIIYSQICWLVLHIHLWMKLKTLTSVACSLHVIWRVIALLHMQVSLWLARNRSPNERVVLCLLNTLATTIKHLCCVYILLCCPQVDKKYPLIKTNKTTINRMLVICCNASSLITSTTYFIAKQQVTTLSINKYCWFELLMNNTSFHHWKPCPCDPWWCAVISSLLNFSLSLAIETFFLWCLVLIYLSWFGLLIKKIIIQQFHSGTNLWCEAS